MSPFVPVVMNPWCERSSPDADFFFSTLEKFSAWSYKPPRIESTPFVTLTTLLVDVNGNRQHKCWELLLGSWPDLLFRSLLFSPFFFARDSALLRGPLLNSERSVVSASLGPAIEYKCEDCRFPVSASCVTISTNSLSSSETGINSGTRSWTNHLTEWAQCQKVIGGIYFTKKGRAETLQLGLEFDNFKPGLKSCIFKCISRINGSFFVGDDRGFLKEESKTHLMAPMSSLN